MCTPGRRAVAVCDSGAGPQGLRPAARPAAVGSPSRRARAGASLLCGTRHRRPGPVPGRRASPCRADRRPPRPVVPRRSTSWPEVPSAAPRCRPACGPSPRRTRWCWCTTPPVPWPRPRCSRRSSRQVRAGSPAVVPGLPVTDTVKSVDEAGRVTSTPPPGRLRAIQTPQGFRRDVLDRAHAGGSVRHRRRRAGRASGVRGHGDRRRPARGQGDHAARPRPGPLHPAGGLPSCPLTPPPPEPRPRTRTAGSPLDLPRTGIGVDVHPFAGDRSHRWRWRA